MKFRLSLPANEEFFQRYAGLVPTLSKLGYLAQVVSALTEVGILFALIRGAVADIAPAGVATVAGIAGAILGTAFIEIGLRKFLPFSARQILNKRFAGLDLVMSIAIFAACGLLLAASGYLSFAGSKETVAVVMPEAKQIGLADSTIFERTAAYEQELFSRDSMRIAARYEAQIITLQAAHNAAQEAAKTKLRSIEAKERAQGQSYATQKASIRQEAADKAAAHAVQVAALHGAQAEELKTRQSKMESELAANAAAEKKAYSNLESRNKAAEEKRERQVRTWGGSVAWFTVLCLFVLILAIALQEVHRHGAGMQEEALPTEFHFRENVVSAFLGAISERWNVWAFGLIKRIEDGTPEPPEPGKPPVLYEYEQKAERRFIGFNANRTHGPTPSVNNGCVITQAPGEAGKLPPKHCEHCGSTFQPKVVWQKFCGQVCKEAHHAAKHGGRKFDPALRRKK